METERQRQTGKERRGMQRDIGTDKLKQKEVERQTTAQKQTEKGREDKQTDRQIIVQNRHNRNIAICHLN